MPATTRIAALGASTLLALAATAATASAAVIDPLPIGPGIAFTGQVGGVSTGAVIQVGCFGPVTPGETGHPLAGQYLEVVTGPDSSATAGYTGTLATSINAYIEALSATTTPPPAAVFTSFYVEAKIPTTINVPCYGPGTVAFVPVPTSPTARTSSIPVTFESEGVAPGG